MKPLRVAFAVLGGLAIGLLLVRVLTPRTAGEEAGEPVTPSVASPRTALPAAAVDAGGPAARVSQQMVAARFPVYPRGGAWVRIGERLDTNRVPMSLVSFETQDDDAKVLEFYAEHFQREGLAWQGIKKSLETVGVPAISATDSNEDLQLSVVAFPHPRGCTVILAAADMKTFYQRVDGEARDDGDFPRYPGSAPAVMRSIEGTRNAVMITFGTKDAVEQVESFYRATLPAMGFHEVPEEAPGVAAMRHLEFVADNGSWRLFLARTKRGTAVTAQGARQ